MSSLNFKDLLRTYQQKRNLSTLHHLSLETDYLKGLMEELLKQGKKEKIQKIELKLKRIDSKLQGILNNIRSYDDGMKQKREHQLEILNKSLENTTLIDKQKSKIHSKIESLKTIQSMELNESIQLSVRNLKMFFGGVKAINDLTFDVHRGEIYGLIGPNGAGKTTVFNCLTQFYRPTGGELIFRNKAGYIVDLNHLRPHQIISEGIARSFQNVELIWELSVIDNLLVAAHSLIQTGFFAHMVHSAKMKREEMIFRTKAMKILADLGILEYAYRSPYGLPYGVLKKIELARTLMTDPTLIILDEPAAGLNESETTDLAETIKFINQSLGITIFLVEHDMSLVMSICDRICAISFGKLIGIGTPSEIQQNPEVRKAYLGDDDDE